MIDWETFTIEWWKINEIEGQQTHLTSIIWNIKVNTLSGTDLTVFLIVGFCQLTVYVQQQMHVTDDYVIVSHQIMHNELHIV